jgi:hypothetical protein
MSGLKANRTILDSVQAGTSWTFDRPRSGGGTIGPRGKTLKAKRPSEVFAGLLIKG